MMTVAEDRVPILALYEESESLNSNSSGLSKRLSSITWQKLYVVVLQEYSK